MNFNPEDAGYTCKWCQTCLNIGHDQAANFIITGGSCISCSAVFKSNNPSEIRDAVDVIDAPILVLQPEPRQVYTANKKACELFGKDLSQVEGFRGGQVFNCIQSFTELGCGKDVNCENCKIKNAIVATFTTSDLFEKVESPLDIKKGDQTIPYLLGISTEKIGNLALVRIDKYQPTSN